MSEKPATGASVLKWLAIFSAWTVVGLLLALQTSFARTYFGHPGPFSTALRVYLTCVWSWFLFTPFILALSHRFAIERDRLARSISIHVAASVVFAILGFIIFETFERFVFRSGRSRGSFLDGVQMLAVAELHADMLRYWAVVGIHHAVRYYREMREREIAASALRAELAETHLELLKRQLHPHFLFNTLNNISVLMFEDPNTANRMLLRLSDLLRRALKSDLPHEVTLAEELEFLERYVEIEKMRFGDRLTVAVDIDPAVRDAHVPNLILQPLVENALKHGVGTSDRAGTVEVSAMTKDSRLMLRVTDDGIGAEDNIRYGIGLANTEARLRQLYGESQTLDLLRPEAGGFSVEISIPLRRATS